MKMLQGDLLALARQSYFDVTAHACNRQCAMGAGVANTILRHAKGILAYITHRVTNAAAESLNARIRTLKTVARGFRTFTHYRTNILSHFGQLYLMPRRTH